MAPTNLDKYKTERDGCEATLSWLRKKISLHTTTPLTIVEVDHYLHELQEERALVMDNHKKILSCSPDDLADQKNKYFSILDNISELQCFLKSIKSRHVAATAAAATPPSSSTPSSAPAKQEIRLPRMELPTFDGTIINWIPYRDMFTAAVGEAARQVHSLTITDANYSVAWRLLEDRYHNEREILFSLLRRFTGQQTLQNATPGAIRSLIDTTKETTRSLEVLSMPVDQWDALLLYLIHQKLDSFTKELWEQTLKDKKVPPLKDLLAFLEQRASALTAGGVKSSKPTSHQRADGGPHRHVNNHHVQTETDKCQLCSGSHYLFKCQKFIDSNAQERNNVVRSQGRCFNCLRLGHSCTSCPSKGTCRTCNKRHHSLLHKTDTVEKPTPEGAQPRLSTSTVSHFTNDENIVSRSILATAIVRVQDTSGSTQMCRALLDSGSSSTFISEACITRLGLRRHFTTLQVTGLCASAVGTVKGSVSLTVFPHFDTTNSYMITGLVLNKVTGKLPVHECDPTVWPHITELQLADPEFHKPRDIDILFGADLFFDIIQSGRRQGPPNTPIALKTALGWLIGGRVNQAALSITAHVAVTNSDLNSSLERFWELESVPTTTNWTEDETMCNQHYEDNYTRNMEGRFIVRLPFKTSPPALGPSRDIAIRRLRSLERRLASNTTYKQSYVDFMKEYISLGHMRKVTDLSSLHSKPNCYIPHHYVLKESSTTTKLRVVFDASARTASGSTLNNILFSGPVLQDKITDIIMRFRTHMIAFTADIEKMYRQVEVYEDDVSMQRIVWREDSTKPIEDYELLTVTYGTSSAPFQATKTLHKLAELEGKGFPNAARVLTTDMYVDDCMSGAANIEEAITLQEELNNLLSKGCFNLRKWSSNSTELLENIAPDQREVQPLNFSGDDYTLKTLGIHWNPTSDDFMFKVEVDPSISDKWTKRRVSSEVAKLFDPLGWLQPVIITAKIGFQELWKLKCDWDQLLPEHLQHKWVTYFEDLKNVETIRIPRNINPFASTTYDLIGFSDASEQAYGAVVYIKSVSSAGNIHISLVSAKTKVAPVRSVTLPRLELCGALHLSALMKTVAEAHNTYSFRNIYAFTDSTITLAWISSHPSRWKTFVQTRVSKIQTNVPSAQWRHVAGKDNPADCASRGITAMELHSHPLWWNGPQWLYNNGIPDTPIIEDTEVEMEERKVTGLAVEVMDACLPLQKYSSISKFRRITAWILRFIHNKFSKVEERRSGPLSAAELNAAQICIVRVVQKHAFPVEYAHLAKGLPVLSKSKLAALSPYLDSSRCIRVGGRLGKADVPSNQKHPLVLPRHHPYTETLLSGIHIRNCHAGPQLMESIVQQEFWILRAKDAIRYVYRRCVVCVRHAAKVAQQMMGDLPSARVTPSRPFSNCGVDFAGPIIIKPMVRSTVQIKVYIAIFICLCTRAIHIEVVSALSTDAFLAAFRRFIARRGKPTDMYSDQGTNFVGAARTLKENLAEFQQNLNSPLAEEGVSWHFNPPSAPHFGGLWEAGVKSMKFHLFRVIGNTRLTYEELSTVLCQIESVLNSRPLTAFSTDPADLTALTPGHFLIGAPLTAPPEPDLSSVPMNRLTRWQLLQQMQQGFWRRWSNEFITRLQHRPKWLGPLRNIQENDMVIVKDDRLAPLHWRLGRVVSCHPGDDGLVRVVTIKTADGVFKRPIVKLCLLPVESSDKVGTDGPTGPGMLENQD